MGNSSTCCRAFVVLSAGLAVSRALRVSNPFVDLRKFRDLSFSLGCALSFVFGFGVYGATYLLSVFLGLVRQHTPLAIGEIMMVSGAVQLLTAPVRRVARNADGSAPADRDRFRPVRRRSVWQTVFPPRPRISTSCSCRRFCAALSIMLCLLPATRLALERWPQSEVPDASGLFNLMRNLGGAIGIALIDTILEQRTPGHVDQIIARLQAGSTDAAREVGLPLAQFHNVPLGPIDELTKAIVAPLVQRAALTESFNEAWRVIAALFAISLLALPLMRRAHIPDSAMGPGTEHIHH